MKKIGYILGSLLLPALFSCTDDINIQRNLGEGQIPDGYLQVEFCIPQAEHIVTRGNQTGNDMKINTLSLFLFNSDGTQLLQREDVDASTLSNFSNSASNTSNSFTYTFQVAKGLNPGMVYAVANADITGEVNTVSDIEDLKAGYYANGDGHYMSGKVEFISGKSFSISLIRTTSKLTLKDMSKNPDFELTGMYLYYPGAQCYIAAGASNKIIETKATSPGSATRIEDETGFRYDLHANPTITHTVMTSPGSETSSTEVTTFVVIKGNYKGLTGFYTVPLASRDNGSKIYNTYYNILPNHWYEMELKAVNSPGYESPELALQNPAIDDVVVDIHDHTADVMAMIADGVHEIGASREVVFNPESSDVTSFVVRLFCKDGNESHYPGISGNQLSGTNFKFEADDWISVSDIEDITNDENQLSGSSNDPESAGRRYKFSLKLDTQKISDANGKIKLSWQGLSLEIPVVSKIVFDPSEILASTTLTIYDGSNIKYSSNNYGDFLKNTVKGIDEEAMGGNKRRDEGFHFPAMYGADSANPWWYQYTIKLTGIENISGYKFLIISDKNSEVWNNLKIKINGQDYSPSLNDEWSNVPKVETNISDLILYRPSTTNDYSYSNAQLTMRVYYGNGDEYTDRKFNLYHTGFFHLDSKWNNDDTEDSYNNYTDLWYYYEVVELADGKHWLDRNIRATSNGLYIQTAGNTSLFSQSDPYPFLSQGTSAGDYLRIARSNSEEPVFSTSICPPGYRIPKKSEFESLRASSDFHTEMTNDASSPYFSSYYQSQDAGKIYFPKSRFKNNGNWDGDGQSGYYWTQSIASDNEPTEIGHWVNAFCLSGNSSSFISADVDNYSMSLRCIEGIQTSKGEKENNQTIGFKFAGATNVYLYYFNNGKKVGLFPFPGKIVGSDLNSEHIFNYNSTIKAEDLYVYFTYKDENGKIWVISPQNPDAYKRDSFEGGNLLKESDVRGGDEISMVSEINGWPVKEGLTYNFLDNAGIFIRGTMNKWEAVAEWKMFTVKDEDNDKEYMSPLLKISKDTEFKFGSFDWGINLGTSTTVTSSTADLQIKANAGTTDNLKMGEHFKGYFKLYWKNNQWYLSCIPGEFNGWINIQLNRNFPEYVWWRHGEDKMKLSNNQWISIKNKNSIVTSYFEHLEFYYVQFDKNGDGSAASVIYYITPADCTKSGNDYYITITSLDDLKVAE